MKGETIENDWNIYDIIWVFCAGALSILDLPLCFLLISFGFVIKALKTKKRGETLNSDTNESD